MSFPVSSPIVPDSACEVTVSSAKADPDLSDNTVSIAAYRSDLALDVSREKDGSVTCVVSNAGTASSQAVLTASDAEGNVLDTWSLGTVEAGSPSTTVLRPVDLLALADDGEMVTFSVSVSGGAQECYLGNNSAAIDVRKTFTQLYDETRYETSAMVAGEAFPDGAPAVIVATGDNYPDALALSGFAGVVGAPIVLTAGDALSAASEERIDTLFAGVSNARVYIAGGSTTVSESVESALTAKGYRVTRIAGATRSGTAIAAYRAGIGSWGSTAVVATGSNFPDALSIAPYAYESKSPVFFSESDTAELSSDTVSAITRGGFTRVIIVGGTASVSANVPAQLRSAGYAGEVMRLSGDTRYETNAAIADWLMANEGYGYANFALATGENFPDALSGITLCGQGKRLLLLGTHEENKGGYYSVDRVLPNSDARHFYVIGGTTALSADFRMHVLGLIGWW